MCSSMPEIQWLQHLRANPIGQEGLDALLAATPQRFEPLKWMNPLVDEVDAIRIEKKAC